MIFSIFLFVFLPLYLVFTMPAFSYKSLKIYWHGVVVSVMYFLTATEGVVWVFNKKVPLGLGMFFNPYRGTYKLFLLNYQYNKFYFWLVLAIVFSGWLLLRIKVKKIAKKNILANTANLNSIDQNI